MTKTQIQLPLVVFSHLRWDFVYQRPQHLLSRLAKSRRVIVIEEPLYAEGEARWERSSPVENVMVCRLRTSKRSEGFTAEQVEVMRPMVRRLLTEEGVEKYVVWCYTAMAYPLAAAMEGAEAVVFDVMDELSAFKGAPAEMLENERRLMKLADVVFTGGPSLFKAKKGRHPNVHCFASSVDTKHFGAARAGTELVEAEDQKKLGRPRLGFYGVIDERMDLGLVAEMAKAHPEWQIVMVGPVVKIGEADLPRAGNIHYMGQRGYAELPRFLKGWDVCLLPFAINESTKFISPTKTLEYMAAERQIVSTPITDVAEPYEGIVLIGRGPGEFIAACEKAIAMTKVEAQRRIGAMRKVLAQTSWDATAESMSELMDAAVRRNQENAEIELTTDRHRQTQTDDENESVIDAAVVVIGAGPTGLSATYHLGKGALLIEQNDRVGGWCRSIEDRGFTFDHAGHIMFSNDPYVHALYKKLLGDNVHWQNREAWIYSKHVYTRYPFQGSLYGLPPAVIQECLVGAIEARFGSLNAKVAPPRNDTLKRELRATAACSKNNGKLEDCCGDGVAETELGVHASACPPQEGGEPQNFEEFIYQVWGAGVAKHFAIPYNRKIWAVDLKEMETSWLGGRVPLPNLEEMIRGALEPAPAPMGPNARFGYPLRGGFQALMNGFLPYVKDRLMLETRVVAISPKSKRLKLSTGQTVRYEQLISTMPLPVLVRMAGAEAPEAVREAAAKLRHTSVRCVNLGVTRAKITEKHWIYYPEETVFHRIFVQGNASPYCNPRGGAGGFGFTCEITYGPGKPLPCEGEALIELCIRDARRVGFIREDDEVICSNAVDMPYAYVVYDHERPKHIAVIRAWLARHDIVLAGRYSEWEYYNSDHAFLAGKRGAEEVRKLRKAAERMRAADDGRWLPERARELATDRHRQAQTGFKIRNSNDE
ncbi:MAG: FAD-dependent oxidoreductase [Phycisphaerales bacterium]|nr:FAD-dependent oxidoreductase [Phycisphaerales bacterium]